MPTHGGQHASEASGGVRRVASAVVSLTLITQLITIAPPVAVAKPAPSEIVSMRGARSKIMDNGDGTFTYEAYPEPIHYLGVLRGRWSGTSACGPFIDGGGCMHD